MQTARSPNRDPERILRGINGPALLVLYIALALMTLSFVYVVKPLLQLRRPYRVVASRPVADRMGTWSCRTGSPMDWSGPVGELTRDMLKHCLKAAHRTRRTYFVCGPPPMMNSVERSLLAFGVPGRQIIAECFKYD